jgi:hypothetical protein
MQICACATRQDDYFTTALKTSPKRMVATIAALNTAKNTHQSENTVINARKLESNISRTIESNMGRTMSLPTRPSIPQRTGSNVHKIEKSHSASGRGTIMVHNSGHDNVSSAK